MEKEKVFALPKKASKPIYTHHWASGDEDDELDDKTPEASATSSVINFLINFKHAATFVVTKTAVRSSLSQFFLP